jgi:Uma2 family endonuclease
MFMNVNAAVVLPEYARPIRRHEYEKMVELGIFAGERVELLYGVIVRMPPKGAPHDSAIQRFTALFLPALSGKAAVRIQSSFAASDGSEPEPDVAVVPPGEYRDAHPTRAHLIVEVADSSLEVDRGIKAQLYAESGVTDYWVLNVRDGILEVHSEIVNGAYTRVQPLRASDRIRLLSFPDVELEVARLL